VRRLKASPIPIENLCRLSLVLFEKKNAQSNQEWRWPQVDQLERRSLEKEGNPKKQCEVGVHKERRSRCKGSPMA